MARKRTAFLEVSGKGLSTLKPLRGPQLPTPSLAGVEGRRSSKHVLKRAVRGIRIGRPSAAKAYRAPELRRPGCKSRQSPKCFKMICLKSPHTSFKPKWPNVAQRGTGASNPPGSCSFQGSERTMSAPCPKTCRNEGTKRPLLSNFQTRGCRSGLHHRCSHMLERTLPH